MAKIRDVTTFTTAQAAKSMLTSDHQNVNVGSVIEPSDVTGMQGQAVCPTPVTLSF